ncbi:hypothetical protein HOY82DRAFT_62671 [Tuber indicum]|nr:hypothetical protein HOY82DRAFT_62671 [Tuber indicum]
MHFPTSLFLSGFLTLGAAISEGVSGGRNHQYFHRRHARVDGVAPAEVMPAAVEPAVVETAHVEPATVHGPPNNAVVDISTPPNNALTTSASTIVHVTGTSIQTLVPTAIATVVDDSTTLLTSLSTPLATSGAKVAPTNGGTHELSSSYGIAPTSTSATAETVVSSTPPAKVTSIVVTTESIGVVTSITEGGSVFNCSSTSSLMPPTTLNTTSTSPSRGVNATTTPFSTITGNATIHPITSTPVTTNTTTNTTTTRKFSTKSSLATTSTSTPTAAWSSSTKTSSTPALPSPSTTYKLTLATPSASAVASQSNGLDMGEFNKTKPCFDKKCEDPGSEMTFNKTVTFNVGSGGDGGIRLGKGPDVASAATGGRGGGTLRTGISMVVVVVVGVSIALGVL